MAQPVGATVTQVDGTIVPVTNRMQQALDTFESPAGSINAVIDAAEFPQIFRPRLSSPVVFLDVREGAGFENSFGWYNVGDDVSTPAGRTANLHPVMGCGTPMVNGPGNSTTHSGNPAFYFQNAEEPNTISVNFQMERTDGRYKGGFIGFYLITPETNSSDNCGDFKNGANGMTLFGFIYFTQKDLNNDGDFVHHLVYKSAVPDRFFFGFEDLFRGGDNDYEDMAMRIDGLTPPCVPTTEVCDGFDNDCDGLVDSADPDLTGVADPCSCDGVSLTCDNGPRFGTCRTGVTVCTGASIKCHGTGSPTVEICDGFDNNCNNVVDDNPSGTGATCDGTDADLCREGTIVCVMGSLSCNDSTGANQEICNLSDDDCDGLVDEGDPGGGGACGSALGVCTPGTLRCSGGTLMCQGGNGSSPELCNNLDDDCDGVTDDSPTDVGQSCGMTDEGVCAFGQSICVSGTLQCAGEIGPTTERCNGFDDNCNMMIDDNPVDAGQPCGSSIGACDPGMFVCMNGMLACTGGIGPTGEICNGIDDDCDGTVDEMVPGEGVACGGGGPCAGGMTKCISGAMVCVGGTSGGTEVCNGLDDDCDTLIDEGDLCNGGVCDNGVCASLCLAGEFPCPNGKQCENDFCVDEPCFGVTCPLDAGGNLQSCTNGTCSPVCPTMVCPIGYVCRGSDASCVMDTCEYIPSKCSADQLCVDGVCTSNPCLGVTCPGDQFCRGGACVGSCQDVQCATSQVCVDGACVTSGCSVTCPTEQLCNPMTHECQASLCEDGVLCPPTQTCDPLTGGCVPDPCQGVSCPNGQFCSRGQCGIPSRGEFVTTGGGGGCSTGGDGSLVLGLIAVGLLLRCRLRGVPRGRTLLAVTLAGGATLSGCKVNEYCLGCEVEDAGVDGDGDGAGSGGDGGPICDPIQSHPESCNHADDDCDGNIDEAFDLNNDELDCGACGVQCSKAGAVTHCHIGMCEITGCFPGFNDVNGDITGPYLPSDGCEYQCFSSNGGVEACDGLDNNCNGVVDEGFASSTDVNNCGSCNHVCEFFSVTPHCTSSMCVFDPAVDCLPGFFDIDGNPVNGCEYQCTPTNGGVESCDVLDNNCNGQVDESFDFQTDGANCGRCGIQCQFSHANATCTTGMCGFATCEPGYIDADMAQVNGCEYLCTPTNGGVEICDGIDNDCDGAADVNPVDAGAMCASTGTPSGLCQSDGIIVCTSGALVCSGGTTAVVELCDSADNDCDGMVDDNVTRSCYTGPMGTSGLGVCRPGVSTCTTGTFGGCVSQVVPSAEQCNNLDDNCNGMIDDAVGGGVITASCYSGAPGTAGVGACMAGTQTCAFGTFGTCIGEVDPLTDVCGDLLDSDCDNRNDTAEGCLALDAEQRLDVPGGALGEAAGAAAHSYDIQLASNGAKVYAVWSQLVGTVTEVYFRASADGGQTWGTIINVTSGVARSAVKPAIEVAPGAVDRIIVAYQTVNGGVRDIQVSISSDGGVMFGAASAILDISVGADSFHHSIAIRGSNCVVAWEQLDTSSLNRDVMSRSSTNGCATFNAEIKVNVGSPAVRFAGRPQVGITASGGVVWAWREQRTGATRDMFAAAVATTTATPAADIRIDADTTDKHESDFPVLIVNETAAHLVWQDVSTLANGGSDAMYARSTNGGVTWGAERVIDDPPGEVSSSFTPAMALDPKAADIADDVVAIVWEDRREGSQIYSSVSTNGGTSFGLPTRASSEAGDPATGQSRFPQIAAAGSGVLVAAYENQFPGAPRSHVFVATSIDRGLTWTYTHSRLDAGVGSAAAPTVIGTTIASKPAGVSVWTDFRTNQINGDIFAAVSH